MVGMAVAVVLAIGVGYWLGGLPSSPGTGIAPPARLESTRTPARVSTYVKTVADALRLPNGLAQTEALITLAGRADEDALKALIAEARSLPGRTQRLGALGVLLQRYSEIDAPAALAIATEIDADSKSRIGVIRGVIAAWASNDFDAAAKAAAALPTSQQRYQAAWALVSSSLDASPERLREALSPLVGFHMADAMLAETGVDDETSEPARALRRAEAGPKDDEQRARIYQIAVEWAERDPVAALAHAHVLTDEPLLNVYRQTVAKKWADRDPDGFLAQAVRSQDPALYILARDTVMPAVALKDPMRAMRLADRLPEDYQDYARDQVLDVWVSLDPVAAAAWVETLAPERQARFVPTVADAYLRRDADAALAWTQRLTSPEREKILAQLLSRLALLQPEIALRALPLLSSADKRLEVLSMYLAERPDAAVATAFLQEFSDGRARRSVASQLALGMAARDPELTLRWLRSVAPEMVEGANFVVLQSLYQWALRDPQAAMAYADNMGDNSRAAVVPRLAAQISAMDPASALSWIKRYADEPFAAQVVDSVGESLASRDPKVALALAGRLEDPRERQSVMGMAARWMSRSDSQAALDLFARIQDPDVRVRTAREMVGTWANEDLESAARWVLTMRPEPAKDAALVALIDHAARFPESALQLTGWLPSEDERFRVAARTVATLAVVSPDAAREFVDRVAVDESHRQRLERGLDRIERGDNPCEW